MILLFFTALAVFCGAGWAFLNKGLYLLPDKMCEGTIERDTVKDVLPNARSAESGSDRQGAGDRLRVWCHVTTSNDSLLSGQARVEPVSRGTWLKSYQESGETQVVRVSAGGIDALARLDTDAGTSSVYVPCSPPDVPSYNASRPYAVVSEAWVHGPARAEGAPLRQTLTDFAYRLTEHAYELAGCEKPRDFPDELPRYGSG
ncbi:hypothetical protein ACF073_17205 [Streptomyces sp. NPDC015171]|uniref:hypothetical protein n=1 Tax=Streptomyces sp. NPDC015171 TaxID=3364945 RepID=UPI0036F83F7D